MTATTVDVKEQAMWLAQGYVQGQRDLLVRILEHRFTDSIPETIRARLATVPAHKLESLGPLLLTAPDIDAVSEAAEVFAAD